MNARIIGTLFAKDFMLYFRNRFFAYITLFAVVMYIIIYALMPAAVDEDLTVALYAPAIPPIFLQFLGGNDIQIAAMDSEEALREAIASREYSVGLALSVEATEAIVRGAETSIPIYFMADLPQEVVDAMRSVLRLAFNELSYTLSGNPLRLELREQIIGPDMAGQQIAARDRLVPLLAAMLLIMEMMGLASLITEEVEQGTLPALLITPASMPDIFIAKAGLGIGLAFVQAALVMAFTGNLGHETLLLLVTLLLGGMLVTGLGFLIASVSRDMMSVFGWSMVVIILMFIPAFGVVFPGTLSAWAQFIPSYYLLDTIHQVINFGASWGAVTSNLLVLLAFGVVLLGAGIFVMERKMR